eukprot:NODE_79_length_22985_cov_0.358401.p11 type:complete len:123 gc:universal NODE_79_length_22985_cov_0.358401:10578-10946(+)
MMPFCFAKTLAVSFPRPMLAPVITKCLPTTLSLNTAATSSAVVLLLNSGFEDMPNCVKEIILSPNDICLMKIVWHKLIETGPEEMKVDFKTERGVGFSNALASLKSIQNCVAQFLQLLLFIQ